MDVKWTFFKLGAAHVKEGKSHPAYPNDDEYMDGWDQEQARQSGDFDPATYAEQRELDSMGSSNV